MLLANLVSPAQRFPRVAANAAIDFRHQRGERVAALEGACIGSVVMDVAASSDVFARARMVFALF